MTLSMGVGVSAQADVFVAGQDAAQQVIESLHGEFPDLVLVFCSIRFADPRLIKAIRAITGKAPLVGCTDAGGIAASGPTRRSVTVIGLKCDGGRFITAVERGLSTNASAAGQRLAHSLMQRATLKPRGMLVFPDGLSANGSLVLAGIEKKIGRQVPVAGAAAADDLYFQKTFQFFDDEILTDSLPGVLFCGDIKVGIGVRHGWVPVGRPRRVTRANGNVVYELDRRPALSIYEDFLGLKGAELMEETLAHTTLTYPLGSAVSGQSEYLLREAIRVGRGGSLICTGSVTQGSEVSLMIGDFESALEAAQQATHDAVEQLRGTRPQGALVFCSVARQKMLGSEYHGEIDVVRNALGGAGVRMGGFYSYGELAPAARGRGRGKSRTPLFHNESMVVVALG